MNRDNSAQEPAMLRQEEAAQLREQEPNPITAQLMEMAQATLIIRSLRGEKGPIADFDLRYFMEVIQEFCGQHDTLRAILAARGEELTLIDPPTSNPEMQEEE